ncbi:hypothetical protein DEU56DRAFT_722542 [Suillus clintonianus]|uniref:uncharacterized protein n=1 Tax=Suillus clintonianus TaxID=1904413 RepID=UPI001B882478|nr:uncharacterized protein DEU56DRAFT_722542 [Suillus clintonianus]KAG2157183.1 hypothetical protein DEU56DRAFT_722542 [Suillus clintonianus]
MSNDIELEDFSGRIRPTRSDDETHVNSVDQNFTSQDGAIGLWVWISAAFFFVFSTSLLLFPRFLLFMAEPSGGRSVLSPLESFFAAQLGIVMGAVALTLVVMIPNASPIGFQQDDHVNSHPLLVPVTSASVLLSFLSYNASGVGSLGNFVLLGSSLVSLFGLWVLLFAGPSVISKKTGADKRTSAFIFGNKNAASVRKKEWSKQQTRNTTS